MEFDKLCKYAILFFAGILIGKSWLIDERTGIVLFFGTFVLYIIGYFNGWTKQK